MESCANTAACFHFLRGAAAEAAVMPFMLMGQVNISGPFPYRSIYCVTSRTSMEAVQKINDKEPKYCDILDTCGWSSGGSTCALTGALRLGPRVLSKGQILVPLNLNLCCLFSLLLRLHFLMTSKRCYSEHLFHF